MKEDTPNRFGKFLIIVGLLLWVAFFATDHVRDPEFGLFLWGMVCLGLGSYLVLFNRRPPPQSATDRFKTARRASKGFAAWRARRKDKVSQKKK